MARSASNHVCVDEFKVQLLHFSIFGKIKLGPCPQVEIALTLMLILSWWESKWEGEKEYKYNIYYLFILTGMSFIQSMQHRV